MQHRAAAPPVAERTSTSTTDLLGISRDSVAHCWGVTGNPLPPPNHPAASPLRRVEAAAARVRLPDPPAALRAKLDAAFEPWAAERRGPNIVQRLVASLTFDGFANSAVAGARGGSATDRQLLFGTDIADVAFHVLPGHAGTMVLDGQVLLVDEEAETDADVALISIDGDGFALATVRTDEVGQFRIEGVTAGSYRLSIDLGACQIDIGPFEVTTS
jgi:hypothetical protein